MIRYKQLANDVLQDIIDNRLVIGSRMPSVRQFAKLHNVSMTTALNCYHKLHEQGWLNVKPQSGHYVTRPLICANTPTFPHFLASITVPTANTVVEGSSLESPFYAAQLAPNLIPLDAINRCFHRGSSRHLRQHNIYPPINGDLSLRRALSLHFSENYLQIEAEQLVVTNGCIDAVRSAIEIVSDVGDTIAIASPCFSGLLTLLLSMKRKVLEIPCHNAELDLNQLELYMQKGVLKAGLFSANFINPHGLCFSVEQKQSIANLAERYQVPIIEDDVFLELGFSGFKPKPIKYWDDKGWVLWCGSISKTVAPIYRLGWCAPGQFEKAYLQQRRENSLYVNLPVQAAFYEFFNSGQYAKHVKRVALHLFHHTEQYQGYLTSELPDHTKISSLQGGMVLWVQIKGLDVRSLCKQAVIHNVNIKSGAEFSTLPLYSDSIRLNIGWPLDSEVLSGVKVGDKLALLCQLINILIKQ